MDSSSSTSSFAEGAVCVPNISPMGVRRRRQAAMLFGVVTLASFAALAALHVDWYWRALLFLPAAITGVSWLQARRNTCVARAREGTLEHDDFSKTAAPPEQVAASRKVAKSINRDGALIGLACAAVGVLSAFVF